MRIYRLILTVASFLVTNTCVLAIDAFKSFGTIHSLDKLGYWSMKEEKIYHAIVDKLSMIEKEIDLLERCSYS